MKSLNILKDKNQLLRTDLCCRQSRRISLNCSVIEALEIVAIFMRKRLKTSALKSSIQIIYTEHMSRSSM